MRLANQNSSFLIVLLIVLFCCKQKDTTQSELIPLGTAVEDTMEIQALEEENNPCGKNSFNLEQTVVASANLLKGTPYSQANKTDCSGMFHKMVNILRDSCPDVLLPKITSSRSSRDIANWYHKNGNLTIIRDPNNSGHLIKPGAVMFYGYGSRTNNYDYRKITIDSLILRNKGINHIAIVTSVNIVNDRLESYEIFHGRNPSKPAGITTSRRVYSYQVDLPVYGNWKEPLLAVADVFGEVKE
jgi:hypothetical protein